MEIQVFQGVRQVMLPFHHLTKLLATHNDTAFMKSRRDAIVVPRSVKKKVDVMSTLVWRNSQVVGYQVSFVSLDTSYDV